MENGFGRIFYDFTQDGWSQNLCTFLLLFLRGSRTGGEGLKMIAFHCQPWTETKKENEW